MVSITVQQLSISLELEHLLYMKETPGWPHGLGVLLLGAEGVADCPLSEIA